MLYQLPPTKLKNVAERHADVALLCDICWHEGLFCGVLFGPNMINMPKYDTDLRGTVLEGVIAKFIALKARAKRHNRTELN